MARRLVACLLLTSCLAAGQSTKYALKGLEVSLMTKLTEQPTSILWKHNGNKVVEFDGSQQQAYGSYEGRITLDWAQAHLSISGLQFEDTGDYELEAFVNKKIHRANFDLKVIDKVPKPSISCEMNDGDSSNISGALVCTAEPLDESMKFEWKSHGKPGPQFTIPLGNKHDDEVYNCIVSNPLSNEMATFTAKDCYPDKRLLVAMIILGILLLLLICLAIFFYMRHRKARPEKEKRQDLENQTPRGSREEIEQLDGDKPKKGNVLDKIKVFETERSKGIHPKNSDKATVQEEEETPLVKSNSAAEHTEDGNSHQVTLEPTETNSPFEKRHEPISDGSEEEAEEYEDAQSSLVEAEMPRTAQPRLSLTSSSSVEAPGELKAASDSDQVNRESDSSDYPKINASDVSTEEKQPSSTVPEQTGPETSAHEQDPNLSEGETLTGEDDQQETNKPPEDCSESGSVEEEVDSPPARAETPSTAQQDLDLAPSEPPRSPTPTKPDNTSNFQEVNDENRQDLPEPEAQSESSPAQPGKGFVKKRAREIDQLNVDPSMNILGNQGLGVGATPQDETPEGGSEEAEEDKALQSPPARDKTPSTPQPQSPLTKSSPNMPPEEESASDQINRECDSSDGSAKEKEPSPIPEQRGPETSADEQEPNEGTDHEEKVEEENLYLATPEPPLSPTQTKPDDMNTDDFQDSQDAAHADSDRHEDVETNRASDESEEQSGGSTAHKRDGEAVENECGPKVEKPDYKDLTDSEQKKNEDAE